jgi:hypothetical protein
VLLAWVPVGLGLTFPPRSDELGFHIPNIQRFADHFPTLEEMRETDLAVLPIFHGILGALTRVTGTSLLALRLWMAAIGLGAIACYAILARRLLGRDGVAACLGLAAFPYFGVTYFVVMTDTAAFLVLALTMALQIRCLDQGRARDFALAGAAGLLLGLLRQNLILAHGGFLLVLAARAWMTKRRLPAAAVPALALPFVGLAFEVALWGGLLPPATRGWPGWYDARPLTHLLGIVSIAANVGYYLIPAAAAHAIERRRALSRRAALAIVVGCALGALLGGWLRGEAYVSTYGTYRHILQALSERAGLAASGAVVFASLLSFVVLVGAARSWVAAAPPAERWARLLPLFLLLAGPVVMSFGIFRIFERHILPIEACAILAIVGAASPWTITRKIGFALLIVFGAAHGALYALRVHAGGG